MSTMISLFTADRYAGTPAFVNDKRWTQAETRELLERVSTSEVRTAPATHRHQMWAELGKTLSQKRTAKEACNKYHQVCSHLVPSGTATDEQDIATNLPVGDAVVEGDVLDQAIADSLDDSKPRRLAFASPAPVNVNSLTTTDPGTTLTSASAPASSSSSVSSPSSTTTTTTATTATTSSSTISTSSSLAEKKDNSNPSNKPNNPKKTTQTKSKSKATEKAKFKPTSVGGINIGDTVMVDSRTWPGVNKPGGAGRVASINMDRTFNIKYMLGGSERGVEADYVHLRNLTANAGERKRGRRTFYNPTNNEAVVPDDDGIVRSKQQEEEEARAREAKAIAVLEAAKKEATEAKLLKEAEEKKLREKTARKNRAATAKRNRRKNNASSLSAAASSSSSSSSSTANGRGNSEHSLAKKKRRRNGHGLDPKGSHPSKKQKSRSRANSSIAASSSSHSSSSATTRHISMEEEIHHQMMRSSSVSRRAREMEEYVPPQIEWPLPPLWMGAAHGRPTLFQAAQFVATKEEHHHVRQGWLTEVLSRTKN
jgi:hypothetical protein